MGGSCLTGECCEWGAPVAGDQRLGRPLLPGGGELPSPICSEYVPRYPFSLPGKQRMPADGGDGRRVVPRYPRMGLERLYPHGIDLLACL